MSPAQTRWYLIRQLAVLWLLGLVAAPLWPVYLLVRLCVERPPILPTMQRVLHTLGLILTERPPAPGLSVQGRLALALSLFQRVVATPLWGLSWMLDELLYGHALADVRIVAPLFEISAARSGSTQLAHYLEDDPQIVAPSVLQAAFPFVWLWKIAPYTLARLVPVERARQIFLDQLPKEYLERHEMDPFRTDTLEILYFIRMQLGDLMFCLGPRVLRRELSPGQIQPGTEEVWEDSFLRYIDALGRKTLLHQVSHEGGSPRRLMLKGHFLNVAARLERRYPDARFLTMIRPPEPRLRSVINFLVCQKTNPVCGPVPFSWAVEHAMFSEPLYCDLEQAFYQQTGGASRTVVRFDDYVRDLAGTMQHVYRSSLGQDEPSPHVPTVHAPRQRENYTHDRSLEALGVDVPGLRERLAAYTAWCKPRRSA